MPRRGRRRHELGQHRPRPGRPRPTRAGPGSRRAWRSRGDAESAHSAVRRIRSHRNATVIRCSSVPARSPTTCCSRPLSSVDRCDRVPACVTLICWPPRASTGLTVRPDLDFAGFGRRRGGAGQRLPDHDVRLAAAPRSGCGPRPRRPGARRSRRARFARASAWPGSGIRQILYEYAEPPAGFVLDRHRAVGDRLGHDRRRLSWPRSTSPTSCTSCWSTRSPGRRCRSASRTSSRSRPAAP